MSISVGHRAIATAFGWGHGSTRQTAATLPAADSRAATSPEPSAAVPAAVESGVLVCSPWEGLYLDQAHPMTAILSEAATSQQLDSFLNSLMYGE